MGQDLQRRLERDPEFFSKIITGDETWVYRYKVTSVTSMPKKAKQVHSNVKPMLMLFFLMFKELCIMNLFYKDKL
jgi:hypothetical protein